MAVTEIRLTASGTWIVPAGVSSVNIFLVGGGGGYTKTFLNIPVTPGQAVPITVGPAGSGTTQFLNTSYQALGGNPGATNGGNGGSGGGGGGRIRRNYTVGGAGGSNGGNGVSYQYAGGIGQGTTTRAFGEVAGELFAGGGGGYNAYYGYVGSPGAGDIGRGGTYGGAGSTAGIILVRYEPKFGSSFFFGMNF